MRALEKAPDARPQSAAEVLQALDGLTTPSASASGALGGTHTPTGARRRRWRPAMTAVAAALVLALGAGGIIVWQRVPAAAAEAGPKRIAVLPFENQGAAEDEYFADGITDEIRGKLGEIPGIEVIARGSSTPYKNSSKTPQEIAKELGVRYLLTAVVRWEKRADGQSIVHVTPELVEVDGDAAPSSRWQDRFDQPLTNVFQVQADIAGRVAAALDVALGAPARTRLAERPTANLAAYDAYLKGVAGLDAATNSATALRRTVDQFERAVALDSTFASAWAQLARSLALLYGNGSPSPAVMQRARAAAERLAALSPNSAQTHATIASVLRAERETERAMREYDLALAAAPNDPDVLRAVASGRRSAGRWEESLAMLQRAEALDPRSVQVLSAQILVQLYLRRPEEVLATAARARLLAPSSLDFLEDEVAAHLQQGDLDEARRTVARASNLDQPSLVAYFGLYWDLYWVLDEPQQQLALRLPASAYDNDEAASAVVRAEIYALRGDQARKRAYADTAQMQFAAQLKETPDNAQRHVVRGLALAYLGRKAEALQEAERAAELLPASKDAYTYAYILHQRVRIYLEVGETERALDGLGELLARPYFVTREWLRIDPNIAPLRGNPRFEKLAAER
jgi:TolB-like protein/Flp pilus assembly protein TadD